MKKLSLKKLNLQEDELLQRKELKSVFGGYGGPENCTTVIDHKYIYSGGELVSEACLWQCSNGTIWGGCPLIF